jgi:SAM-dependent methyltransferase
LLWTAGTAAAALHPATARQTRTELSIRNATDRAVVYRLRRFDAEVESPPRSLAPGGIDRFPGTLALDLELESGGRRLEYRLDPGGSYTFRYDSQNEVDLFLGSHGRDDVPDLAPYVATPMPVVRRMLELADLREGDVLYDLGCGDGRIVVEAARRYGVRAVGVDLDPRRIDESRHLARRRGVEHLVEFRVEDAMATDLSGASVVAIYLLPESNALLRPRLERQLTSGARVVSHDYEVPGWEPVAEDSMVDAAGRRHYLYAYRIGGDDGAELVSPATRTAP